MLAAYGALLGAILGVRYRVFVLVPTILAGAALVGAVAMVQGASPLRAAEAMVVLGVLLQVGYICSSLIRHAVVPPDWATRPSLLVASSSGRRKPRATP